jgi:hypothetical protein
VGYEQIRYAMDGPVSLTSFLKRRAPDLPGRVPADLPPYLPWPGDGG